MNIEPQTEEQKHVKRLLERWNNLHRSSLPFWFGILFALSMAMIFGVYSKNFWWMLPFYICIIGGSSVYDGLVRKRFIKRMSMTEGRLLRNAGNYQHLSRHEQELALELNVSYQKTNPEMELLRAFSPNEDDGTLLRAARHSSEIPREELLRASNPSKHEQSDKETLSLKAE
jgi:hypothetical protein